LGKKKGKAEKIEQISVEKEDNSKYIYGTLIDDSTGMRIPFEILKIEE
jgi:hypothetical protein